MSENIPSQTPLIDLLRGVPADAHAVYEEHPTAHRLIPYGRLCNEAAAELDALRAEVARLRAALEAAPPMSAVYDDCDAYDYWFTTTRREALDG